MSMGRPTKWATARITEPIELGRAGMKIVIWDKYAKRRRGKLVVSVGGIRWYPYKFRYYRKLSWNKLDSLLD
jgi:hypothetical protein